jgi:MYXO-CTERM domain-containing protein
VTPALPACFTVTTIAEDCNCGVALRVVNRCQQAIVASDFEFDSCWSGSGPVAPCSSLEPAFQGNITFRLSQVGRAEQTLSLSGADGTHEVVVESNVASFVDGGCTGCAHASQRVGPASSWALLVGLAAACLRRRRRKAVARYYAWRNARHH